MADTQGVLARLQAALSTYDPSWDVGVGSATYKILESVAQEIAYANNNSVLQTYSYDVNTKFGNELDAFCNLFGVYRQLGKRATGVVTFTVNSAAASIIDIPLGTQVAVPIGGNYTSPIYFSTTAPAIIGIGDTSVDVPVISTLPGINGNVPSNTINLKVTTLNSVSSVNNNGPTNGGTDPESDAQLRTRWQRTAFSSNTGTNGKYIITALQDPNVTSANAIGQQTFYDEQLQVNATVSGGTTNNVTFQFVAYSGTINPITGSGYTVPTVVATSGFTASSTGSAVASGIQAMISGVMPANSNTLAVTVTPTGNTISGGLTINFSGPSVYRLTIGSGNALNGAGVVSSGVVTISGTKYTEYVQSSNPDIGVSGTMSYNSTFSGYLFPQGNELVGSNLTTSNQVVYAPNSDYYYPSPATPQLTLTIANGSTSSGLFIGNTVEVISEYNPASSRSTALASGNYVDIFINGTTATLATEQAAFNPSYTLSSGNANSLLNTANYVLASGSLASSNTATSGEIFVPLDRKPLINFPSQLSTATSGVADTVYVYNAVTGSGYTFPIALNRYNYITFTGTAASTGSTFISVNNANSFLYPGLALASGTLTSSGTNYISSVTSSGIYMNNYASATGTNVVMSGRAVVYPLYDTTNNQLSVLDNSGLAFISGTLPTGWPAFPTALSWVQYSHAYNNDVTDVESLVQQSRPIGSNTLVHQASFKNIRINTNIVFSAGYSISTVQANITYQIQSFFSNFGFLGAISFAELQSQILYVSGVTNVKITSIDILSIDGTKLTTFTSDFILASNQLPQLYSIVYTIKGASNF